LRDAERGGDRDGKIEGWRTGKKDGKREGEKEGGMYRSLLALSFLKSFSARPWGSCKT